MIIGTLSEPKPMSTEANHSSRHNTSYIVAKRPLSADTMRHTLIELCGLAVYLLYLPFFVRTIRQQRQSGDEDRARRYTAVAVALAIPLVVVPWLTG